MVEEDARDQEIINRRADALNAEAEDVLGYQDSRMKKTRMIHAEEADVLHLVISEEHEAGSVEISPDITAELNAKGELIGIEMLNASDFIRDSVLDSAAARQLGLRVAKSADRGV